MQVFETVPDDCSAWDVAEPCPGCKEQEEPMTCIDCGDPMKERELIWCYDAEMDSLVCTDCLKKAHDARMHQRARLRSEQLAAKMFDAVSCSQCGQSFGPSTSGYSHCHHHQGRMPKGSL